MTTMTTTITTTATIMVTITKEQTMKTFSLLLILTLAIAGSAYAQSDTSITASAMGTYPAGTLYNGVPLSGVDVASSALIAGDGTAAEGRLNVRLLGVSTPLTGQQVISIQGVVRGGTRTAANVVTISGTAAVNLGNGTPSLFAVPIVATITSGANGTGTIGLIIGAVSLPSVAIGDGSLTIDSFESLDP